MVIDFRKELQINEAQNREELKLYDDIIESLNAIVKTEIDLEMIFTVINNIISKKEVIKFNAYQIYYISKLNQELSEIQNEISKNYKIAKRLREKYENFIYKKCEITKEDIETIKDIYMPFFTELCKKVGPSNDAYTYGQMPIFTTNYDLCIETYWREIIGKDLNTGFEYDKIKNRNILNINKLEKKSFKLLKLHGSINWLINDDESISEERLIAERTVTGEEFKGRKMILPIEEKEVYIRPFINMFRELGAQLNLTNLWIIIGYSFNDEIIRNIFINSYKIKKRIMLIHPKANEIAENRLSSINKHIILINKPFGNRDTIRELLNYIS